MDHQWHCHRLTITTTKYRQLKEPRASQNQLQKSSFEQNGIKQLQSDRKIYLLAIIATKTVDRPQCGTTACKKSASQEWKEKLVPIARGDLVCDSAFLYSVETWQHATHLTEAPYGDAGETTVVLSTTFIRLRQENSSILLPKRRMKSWSLLQSRNKTITSRASSSYCCGKSKTKLSDR